MPVKSAAQSRYLNMEFGHDWVKKHHFDNSTKGLPEHVKKKSVKKEVSEHMDKLAKGLRA